MKAIYGMLFAATLFSGLSATETLGQEGPGASPMAISLTPATDVSRDDPSLSPTPPANLTLEVLGIDRIAVSWQDRSDDEEAFFVERKGADEESFRLVGAFEANSNRMLDLNLTPETWYSYRVSAVNADGSSEYSELDSAQTEPRTLFDEGFEAYELDSPPDDWQMQVGGNSWARVTDTRPHDGDKSLHFHDPDSGANYAWAFKAHTPLTVGRISTWLYLSQGGYFGFHGADPNWSAYTFRIIFMDDESFSVLDGGNMAHYGDYPTDRWFKVDVAYNADSSLYRVYFDDEQVTDACALAADTPNGYIGGIVFSDVIITDAFMDDILIETPWSPPAAGLVATPSRLDFGELLVGQERELTTTIENTGDIPLRVESSEILWGGDFTIIAGGGEFELAEGERREITTRFAPSEPVGFKQGAFKLRLSGEESIPVWVSLTGVASSRPIVLHLEPGWSMISINMIPPQEFWTREEGPDIRLMMERLRIDQDHSRLVIMKDNSGRFYSPLQDFCNIPYWNLSEGYKVRLNDSVTVHWPGVQIPYDEPIRLPAGWNTIAYFPTYQLIAEDALSSIIESVIIAKDDEGRFFRPEFGFSNMIPWREGEGYQVRVDQNCELRYPPDDERLISLRPVENTASHWPKPVNTGSSMSLLVNLEFGTLNLQSGEVAVLTEKGLCVGSSKFPIPNSKLQIGLAVWGDDPTTPEIDGAVEAEALSFKLWDGTTETVVLPKWKEGEGVYRTDEFAVGEFSSEWAGRPATPGEFALHNAFPNPFNSTTAITMDIPNSSEITLAAFDLAGREVAQLASGRFVAGVHNFVWNAGGIPTGIYWVKLTGQNVALSQKVVLVR